MRKLILIFLLIPTFAFADFKGSISVEHTKSNIEQTIQPYGWSSNSSDSSNNLRLYLGYEQGLSDDLSVDLGSSINLDSLTRTELNFLYSFSDFKVKAGPNLSVPINTNEFRYDGALGYQIGAEYSLDDKTFIDVKFAQMNYTANYKDTAPWATPTNPTDTINAYNEVEDQVFSVGLGIKF